MYRSGSEPSTRRDDLGFRIVRTDPRPSSNFTFALPEEQIQALEVSRLESEPEMILIEEGSFQMGNIQHDRNTDERPIHKVILDAFEIGKYEVTNAEYVLFLNDGDTKWNAGERSFYENAIRSNSKIILDETKKFSIKSGYEKHPVQKVSWHGAISYIAWLSDITGKNYRLPTEAEWEYAARAGTTSSWSCGDDDKEIPDYAWYNGNLTNNPHPVGQKKPNLWKLHDTHGNVWEWVNDWYDQDYYSRSPVRNPKGPENGTDRVIRGGYWHNNSSDLRTAHRGNNLPGTRLDSIGFRLARSPLRTDR